MVVTSYLLIYFLSDIDGRELTRADDLSFSDRHHIRVIATAQIYESLAQLGLGFKERKNDRLLGMFWRVQ